jgi:membrane associated rhomboid family serine protease
MKRYTLASTVSLIAGWLVAMLYHAGSGAGDTAAVASSSFLFLMLANGLFIQWPERYITRFCKKTRLLPFAIISSLYALAVFTLLIGWLFLKTTFYIVFSDAAIIGFTAGLLFHILHRRSAHKWTTSTTPS